MNRQQRRATAQAIKRVNKLPGAAVTIENFEAWTKKQPVNQDRKAEYQLAYKTGVNWNYRQSKGGQFTN